MAYEHIKRLLQDSGKSQADLAAIIGRTPAVVTSLFNGSRSLQIEEVGLLAKHFGVSDNFILYGVDMQRNGLNDAEIALTDAIKDILQVLLHNGLANADSLSRAFTYQIEHYKEKNLLNALTVMGELNSYVLGEQRQPEKDIIGRLLKFPPPDKK